MLTLRPARYTVVEYAPRYDNRDAIIGSRVIEYGTAYTKAWANHILDTIPGRDDETCAMVLELQADGRWSPLYAPPETPAREVDLDGDDFPF